MKRALVAVVSVLAGCAAPAAPTVNDLGGGAFEITRRNTYFSGRVQDLKTQVELDALAVCQRAGKALAVLDSRAIDPGAPAFPSATVSFRCVAP